MVDFRAVDDVDLPKVRLLRKTEVRRFIEDGISPLQVLWIPSISIPPQQQPVIFQNLTSLAVPFSLRSHSDWREILSHSAGTIKHLFIALNGESDVVAPLRLPLLEVLELNGRGVLKSFPAWMVVSSISKLSSYYLLSGLPPIDEMKVMRAPTEETNAASRCPRLRALSYSLLNHYHEELVGFLQARSNNVEAGVEVEGVRMEPLKRLAVPFKQMSPKNLKQLKELVETVVEWTHKPSWELEI